MRNPPGERFNSAMFRTASRGTLVPNKTQAACAEGKSWPPGLPVPRRSQCNHNGPRHSFLSRDANFMQNGVCRRHPSQSCSAVKRQPIIRPRWFQDPASFIFYPRIQPFPLQPRPRRDMSRFTMSLRFRLPGHRVSFLAISVLAFGFACLPGNRPPDVAPRGTLAPGAGEGPSAAESQAFGVVFASPRGETLDPSEVSIVWNRPMRPLELAGS